MPAVTTNQVNFNYFCKPSPGDVWTLKVSLLNIMMASKVNFLYFIYKKVIPLFLYSFQFLFY